MFNKRCDRSTCQCSLPARQQWSYLPNIGHQPRPCGSLQLAGTPTAELPHLHCACWEAQRVRSVLSSLKLHYRLQPALAAYKQLHTRYAAQARRAAEEGCSFNSFGAGTGWHGMQHRGLAHCRGLQQAMALYHPSATSTPDKQCPQTACVHPHLSARRSPSSCCPCQSGLLRSGTGMPVTSRKRRHGHQGGGPRLGCFGDGGCAAGSSATGGTVSSDMACSPCPDAVGLPSDCCCCCCCNPCCTEGQAAQAGEGGWGAATDQSAARCSCCTSCSSSSCRPHSSCCTCALSALCPHPSPSLSTSVAQLRCWLPHSSSSSSLSRTS